MVAPPIEPNHRARLEAALAAVRELEKSLVLLIDQRGGSIDVARIQARQVAEWICNKPPEAMEMGT